MLQSNPLGGKGHSLLVITLRDGEGDVLVWIPEVSRASGEALRIVDTLSGFFETDTVQIVSRKCDSPLPLLLVNLDGDQWSDVEAGDQDAFYACLQGIGDRLAADMLPLVVVERNASSSEILSIRLVADSDAANALVGDVTEPGRMRSIHPLNPPDGPDGFAAVDVLTGDVVIVSGEPGGELAFTGPYRDMEEAQNEAETIDEPWSIHDLQNPISEVLYPPSEEQASSDRVRAEAV